MLVINIEYLKKTEFSPFLLTFIVNTHCLFLQKIRKELQLLMLFKKLQAKEDMGRWRQWILQ